MMVNFRKKLNGAFALRPQNEIDPLQGRRRGSSYCRRIIEFQYYQEGKFSFEMIVKDLIYIEKKKIVSEGHFFLSLEQFELQAYHHNAANVEMNILRPNE